LLEHFRIKVTTIEES
jgi:hypothetical protein